MVSREWFCVILCHMVKLLMHNTMLHLCKITYVSQLGVNGHNCKMWSFDNGNVLHIRGFVSRICYDARGGNYWSIHHTQAHPDLSPCDYDLIPKLKVPLLGRRFRTRDDCSSTLDLWQTSVMVNPMVFVYFHIVGRAQLTVLGITLKACKMLMCL